MGLEVAGLSCHCAVAARFGEPFASAQLPPMSSTTVSDKIRVFVVDDHQVVRMGLKTMLESAPDISVVGVAASSQEAIERIPTVEVDVLLTDLRMDGLNGEEMIAVLHKTRQY